ncbi:hypothetical protein CEXT_401591 [Caerostris extrusa]|uniref:Uncharacterized protein n=1 Tax=Caerostris extrusa TaxID=172846 RepID=A0AAV4U9T5_CAEEX|nr:hypothetical protein CEXT_401591 [Caerostris extrusa]
MNSQRRDPPYMKGSCWNAFNKWRNDLPENSLPDPYIMQIVLSAHFQGPRGIGSRISFQSIRMENRPVQRNSQRRDPPYMKRSCRNAFNKWRNDLPESSLQIRTSCKSCYLLTFKRLGIVRVEFPFSPFEWRIARRECESFGQRIPTCHSLRELPRPLTV